jgi:hypothetical protein
MITIHGSFTLSWHHGFDRTCGTNRMRLKARLAVIAEAATDFTSALRGEAS